MPFRPRRRPRSVGSVEYENEYENEDDDEEDEDDQEPDTDKGNFRASGCLELAFLICACAVVEIVKGYYARQESPCRNDLRMLAGARDGNEG